MRPMIVFLIAVLAVAVVLLGNSLGATPDPRTSGGHPDPTNQPPYQYAHNTWHPPTAARGRFPRPGRTSAR